MMPFNAFEELDQNKEIREGPNYGIVGVKKLSWVS